MNKLPLIEEAKTLQEELVALRRDLHQHPGTGFEIAYSVERVEKELTALGYSLTKCGKAGWTTTIGNGQGPVFLLRADMDGLPIVEDTNLAFAATNDKMHACGHDIHTTMLIGAAKLLKQHEAEINGTVKLMFQPAEETMEGSQDMLAAGVLENPKVDAAMMIHVLPGMPLEDGTMLYYEPGIAMASCDWFDIQLYGQGGHGSTPSAAIDPMIPMANIVLALQELQSRELSVDQPIALTIGQVAGGITNNVIMDQVVLRGTLRTRDEELRKVLKERIPALVQPLAEAYRCRGEVRWGANAPVFQNDAALAAKTPAYLKEILPSDKLVYMGDLPKKTTIMASEDFAYISHQVPTALFNIAAADARLSEPYPVHHPKLVLNEEIFPYGIATLVGMALGYLNDAEMHA